MKFVKFIVPFLAVMLVFGAFWPTAHADKYLRMRPKPTASPTPAADIANRKLYGWNCVNIDSTAGVTSIDPACVGNAATINMTGVAYNVGWWQYETSDGHYNEAFIKNAADDVDASQYIAVYITTGAATEPDWLLAETTNNQPSVVDATPGVPDKPANIGDTLFESRPNDPTFITKWEAMVNHIATTYGPGGSLAAEGAKIARIEIVYNGSHLGNELAQNVNCQGTNNCSSGVELINGGAAACGGSGGFCQRNYNLDAATTAPGMCGASACGATIGGNTAYQAAALTTFENAFSYEASQWSSQNDPWALMTAFVPSGFPRLSSTGGTAVSDNTNIGILAPWLSTQFTKPSYLFNEALGDGSPGGYASLMVNTNHWCGFTNPSTGKPFLCIAQMAAALGTKLKISSIVGNGTTATVTYTCTNSPKYTSNNCITSIGMTAGDTLSIINSGSTYNGTHTVLASPAPNNTVSPYTVSFSTTSSTTFTGTNSSNVIDTSRETSNCTALHNAFNNGNGANVLEIETYEPDFTTCPTTIATQYALMPSS